MRDREVAASAGGLTPRLQVPEHVVFEELPFCAVLLDTRSSRVYRLSRSASAVVRAAVRGPLALSPYEDLISTQACSVDSPAARRLLAKLIDQGLLTGGESDGGASA